MTKDELTRKAKSSLLIRYLAWPYMTIRKEMQYFKYKKSKEGDKLRELKGRFNGQRCFIIGNGPSLEIDDLEKLSNEITIGSNRIYNIFDRTEWRPTYYLAEDEDGYPEMIPKVLEFDISNYILSLESLKYESNQTKNKNIYHALWTNGKYVANRYDDNSIHISEDITDHISVGYTVTFSAIQLAIYMGCNEIYLLGVDFNYAYITDRVGRIIRLDGVKTYFDGKERTGSYLNYYSTLRAYEKAKEYCNIHNIKIYNATRGGKLEVFERIDFDMIIN